MINKYSIYSYGNILVWCKIHKFYNWDSVACADEVIYLDSWKSNIKYVKKEKIYKATKNKKEHKVNACASISRSRKNEIELFT